MTSFRNKSGEDIEEKRENTKDSNVFEVSAERRAKTMIRTAKRPKMTHLKTRVP